MNRVPVAARIVRNRGAIIASATSRFAPRVWDSLRGGRYADAHLPHEYTGGDVLVVETVEYLVEDEHGNLDVTDSRIVGLRATTLEAVRTETGPNVEKAVP